MKLILLAVSILFVAAHAGAKCPLIGYVVSGTVSSEDGKPVKGAAVSVTSLGEFLRAHPVAVSSDDAGEFSVQMKFDTYSGGSVSGDDCFRKPTRSTVAVQADGFNPATKQVTIGSDMRAVAEIALARSP